MQSRWRSSFPSIWLSTPRDARSAGRPRTKYIPNEGQHKRGTNPPTNHECPRRAVPHMRAQIEAAQQGLPQRAQGATNLCRMKSNREPFAVSKFSREQRLINLSPAYQREGGVWSLTEAVVDARDRVAVPFLEAVAAGAGIKASFPR